MQGFASLCWNYEVDKAVAVSLADAPIRRMQEAAKANAITVSFGFMERAGDVLYSSQIFIGADGEIVNVFRRVSIGWKEFTRTATTGRGVSFREGQIAAERPTGMAGILVVDID